MPADLDYPYVWTRDHTPSGKKGQECKILNRKRAPAALNGPRRPGQKQYTVGLPPGVVYVQFRDGTDYRVQESGLEKRA